MTAPHVPSLIANLNLTTFTSVIHFERFCKARDSEKNIERKNAMIEAYENALLNEFAHSVEVNRRLASDFDSWFGRVNHLHNPA